MIVYGFITKDENNGEAIFPTLFTNVERLHYFLRAQGWEKIVSIKSPDGKDFLKGFTECSDVWMEPSKNRSIYTSENKYMISGALGIVYKFTLVED